MLIKAGNQVQEYAYKQTTTSRANGGSATPDPELSIALLPGLYQVECLLFATANGGAIRFGIFFSGTVTNSTYSDMNWLVPPIMLSTGYQASPFNALTAFTNAQFGGGVNAEFSTSTALIAGTAGLLTLNWGQNGSSPINTSLLPGCYLRAKQLA